MTDKLLAILIKKRVTIIWIRNEKWKVSTDMRYSNGNQRLLWDFYATKQKTLEKMDSLTPITS